MGNFTMNHQDLRQYGLLKSQVMELDESISEVEAELLVLSEYNMNISPVYSGMPKGNEKRDKIADFIIRLETDREKLNQKRDMLNAERTVLMYSLHKIRNAVNEISDEQLRQIIKWHYFDGEGIDEIAEKSNLTLDGVYKKINRFFERRKQPTLKQR